MRSLLVLLLSSAAVPAAHAASAWDSLKGPAKVESYPEAFQQAPPLPPVYMVDNTDNKRGVAPVNGKYNGPVWPESGSFEGYMDTLAEKREAGLVPNTTSEALNGTLEARQGGRYWLPSLGPLGMVCIDEMFLLNRPELLTWLIPGTSCWKRLQILQKCPGLRRR